MFPFKDGIIPRGEIPVTDPAELVAIIITATR